MCYGMKQLYFRLVDFTEDGNDRLTMLTDVLQEKVQEDTGLRMCIC